MFGISDDYTIEETLKIMSVRFALFSNYPKFMQLTVASNVSDGTVAMIMENLADLPGVQIKQKLREYIMTVFILPICLVIQDL